MVAIYGQAGFNPICKKPFHNQKSLLLINSINKSKSIQVIIRPTFFRRHFTARKELLIVNNSEMQYYEKKIKYCLHKKKNLYKCAFFLKK